MTKTTKTPDDGTVRYVSVVENISDPRLGRRPEIDVRNSNFPIRAMLPRRAYQEPKTHIWACNTVLDQGQEGSCVGHGFAHELLALPYAIKNINHAGAVKIYKKAQTLDEWPGDGYSGTSVVAGAKATLALFPGVSESYRWAFDINDIVATVGYHGPIIIGVNWYSGMFTPDETGFIHVTGNIQGGHCLLLRGVIIEKNAFLLHNSWGEVWGNKGTCYISFDDMQRLLIEGGDFCIPVKRGWWK